MFTKRQRNSPSLACVYNHSGNCCPVIRAHLHPHCCVIAVQADNEMSFFLYTQPYDHDYSTGAILLYLRFLNEKCRDLS
ncbi:MAG: hypothetical protein U9N46_14530 [Euryarchaeota archaeon]|nr:hypothetical protein [Euryarchaeota archaeon]